MVVKVYISGNSGNKEIMSHQQRIVMILRSLSIEFELVDITAPGLEYARDFMRANGKKKENQRNVLPPQIFNNQHYCGDYDDFDVANEDDELEEFLGIDRITPKSTPIFNKSGQKSNSDAKQQSNDANDQSTDEPLQVVEKIHDGVKEQTSDDELAATNNVEEANTSDEVNNDEENNAEVTNDVNEEDKSVDKDEAMKSTEEAEDEEEYEYEDEDEVEQ